MNDAFEELVKVLGEAAIEEMPELAGEEEVTLELLKVPVIDDTTDELAEVAEPTTELDVVVTVVKDTIELEFKVRTLVETGYDVTVVLAGQLVTVEAQLVIVTTSEVQMVAVTRTPDDVVEELKPKELVVALYPTGALEVDVAEAVELKLVQFEVQFDGKSVRPLRSSPFAMS